MPLGSPPCRIGVVLLPARKLNVAALQFLILAMNKEQGLFQFEFHTFRPREHPLLRMLGGERTVARAEAMELMPEFATSARAHIDAKTEAWGLSEASPARFAVVSPCRFDDNFYAAQRDGVSVLAMGNWKRFMAPPSFVEFVQALLVREAVGALCPSLRDSVHLGTKGCLLDFTEYLTDARQKVLRGYVCHHCRERMREDGEPELAGTVTRLLDREWLGEPADPRTPAGVLASLRYDLFTAKGRQETWLESVLVLLRQEAVRQVVTVAGSVAVVVLVFVLGLRAGGG